MKSVTEQRASSPVPEPWASIPATNAKPAATPPNAEVAVDPVLALLQSYQAGLITPFMMSHAEHRLENALHAARDGRPLDPSLLLRQLVTDLGITLFLP
ncbi:MAG: hypothetical protein ACJ72G_11170 [Friedmanniella sp.]